MDIMRVRDMAVIPFDLSVALSELQNAFGVHPLATGFVLTPHLLRENNQSNVRMTQPGELSQALRRIYRVSRGLRALLEMNSLWKIECLNRPFFLFLC
jgi:hypothetical protein